MIDKERFVEIINSLKEVNDFVDEVNEKASKLRDSIISDFFNASSLSISHEDIVVELLKAIFNDEDNTISWWLYEKNYGTDDRLKMWDKDGNEIDLSTPEKLYEYLLEAKDE